MVAYNCHSKRNNLTAKRITLWQKGKDTVKKITFTAKRITSWQKEKDTAKKNNLMAVKLFFLAF